MENALNNTPQRCENKSKREFENDYQFYSPPL